VEFTGGDGVPIAGAAGPPPTSPRHLGMMEALGGLRDEPGTATL
jgi:hypothetical protein